MILLDERHCPTLNEPEALSPPAEAYPPDVLDAKRENMMRLIRRIIFIYALDDHGRASRFHAGRAKQFAILATAAARLAEPLEADVTIEVTLELEGAICLRASYLLVSAFLPSQAKTVLLALFYEADSVHIAAEDGVPSMTFYFELARD